MRKMMLLAGVAAIFVAMPAQADPGGHGNHGDGGNGRGGGDAVAPQPHGGGNRQAQAPGPQRAERQQQRSVQRQARVEAPRMQPSFAQQGNGWRGHAGRAEAPERAQRPQRVEAPRLARGGARDERRAAFAQPNFGQRAAPMRRAERPRQIERRQAQIDNRLLRREVRGPGSHERQFAETRLQERQARQDRHAADRAFRGEPQLRPLREAARENLRALERGDVRRANPQERRFAFDEGRRLRFGRPGVRAGWTDNCPPGLVAFDGRCFPPGQLRRREGDERRMLRRSGWFGGGAALLASRDAYRAPVYRSYAYDPGYRAYAAPFGGVPVYYPAAYSPYSAYPRYNAYSPYNVYPSSYGLFDDSLGGGLFGGGSGIGDILAGVLASGLLGDTGGLFGDAGGLLGGLGGSDYGYDPARLAYGGSAPGYGPYGGFGGYDDGFRLAAAPVIGGLGLGGLGALSGLGASGLLGGGSGLLGDVLTGGALGGLGDAGAFGDGFGSSGLPGGLGGSLVGELLGSAVGGGLGDLGELGGFGGFGGGSGLAAAGLGGGLAENMLLSAVLGGLGGLG